MTKTTPSDLDHLPGYTGLADVTRPGMFVEECARLIARLAAVKKQSVRLFAARMSRVPEWELKAALARWM